MVNLNARLAEVTGISVSHEEPMASHTTLRIGGPVELLVRARTEKALQQVMTAVHQANAPFQLLGLGSNVLIPDEGIRGVVALLEGDFCQWSFRGAVAEAGAGLPLARLAQAAVEQGLAGLEALAGFPSTVGGAVVMNAGCYGVEIKDVLEIVTVLRPDGTLDVLGPGDLQARYRSTNLQGGSAVVVRATFRLREDDPAAALGRLRDFNRRRRESMPGGRPNAGSVFRNPDGDHAGRLIDACGLKGTRRGGAEISREHANVIVNTGEARAADVLELMELMHRSVSQRFGVLLEPELILAGDLRTRWESTVGEPSVS